MKLYEIDQAIMDCIDMETGEIINEELLNDLQMERDAKIENVALWIKQLKAEAEALKAEKMAFAERQKVAENKVESLKKWLAYALNGEKFKTVRASVTFRTSDKVEVADIYKLDESYLRYREPEADKDAIKKRSRRDRKWLELHLLKAQA